VAGPPGAPGRPDSRGALAAPTRSAARGRSSAADGPLALIAHQARFDLRAAMRNPRARFFTLIFPLLLLVIFDGVFANGTTTTGGVRISTDRFYVAGIATMALITSCYVTLTQRVVNQREGGSLKRRRATPAPAWVLIAGQGLATTAISAGVTAVLLVVGHAAFGVGVSAGALLAVAITVAVGSLAFCCLGYAVASFIDNADAAQPIVQFSLIPLYFISGVWVPTASLPHGVRAIADVFPVAHVAGAMHQAFAHASFGAALAPVHLLVTAAWALGAVLVAARRFSWLPAAATS
jgi:ABC-2 type transport system permease protein